MRAILFSGSLTVGYVCGSQMTVTQLTQTRKAVPPRG
jgi:hypothetical protein